MIRQILVNGAKLLVLTCCLSSAISLYAYNFEIDGICYNYIYQYAGYGNIIGVSVTYKSKTGEVSASGYAVDVYNKGRDITTANIPATVTYNGETHNVTCLNEYAFNNCQNLTSVSIPSSMNISYQSNLISTNTFAKCPNLTTVTLNSNRIASYASFYYSYNNGSHYTIGDIFGSQVKEYIIGDDVTSIAANAFNNCTKMTTLTLSDGVTSIGNYASKNCSTLTSVTLGENLQTIGGYAFQGCTGLTSITIPQSVTTIGNNIFDGCENLDHINITDLAAWCNISFSSYAPLYYAHRLFLNETEITQLVIPEEVKTVNAYAFNGCNRLETICISDSVTNIGTSAFSGCTYLDSLAIGSGVLTNGIGDYAFSNCPYLMSVSCKAEYPPTINANVFDGCGVLSQINLYVPLESVKRYQKADVWSEFNIIGTDFPAPPCTLASGTCGADGDNLIWELGCDSVLTISGTGNMKAYASTSQIPWYIHKESIKEIVLEDSVTSIGKKAFQDCTNLTSVTIGNSITSIGDYAFRGCSSLTSIEIPKGVTSIGTAVFINCSRLTSIVWKARTMSSSGAIFSYIDEQITSFVFGDEVEEIPSMCCVDMFNLISISIPNSVLSIGDGAFDGCYSLGNIYVYWIEPINISGIFDSETHNSANLHVPCRAIAAYRAAEGWKDFNNIVGMDCATYAITWQNYDGFILATDSVLENELPQYTGADPTKPATIEYNYIFDGWTPEVVPVTGDAIYTAHFDSAKVVYDVDVTIPDSIEGQGSVIIEGDPTYGDTITITPVPEDGWYFVEWSDGNTDNPREIIVTGDTIIYPIFAQCEEIIVTFSEVITKGESYEFAGMSLMQRGTYMDTTVLANGCDSITVLKLNVVKAKTFNLRVVVNDETMGTVEGAGTFTQGQEVTITAIPASSKYVFVRWYNEDEDINVYDNPYTFTLNRNLQIRAVFRRGKK